MELTGPQGRGSRVRAADGAGVGSGLWKAEGQDRSLGEQLVTAEAVGSGPPAHIAQGRCS